MAKLWVEGVSDRVLWGIIEHSSSAWERGAEVRCFAKWDGALRQSCVGGARGWKRG